MTLSTAIQKPADPNPQPTALASVSALLAELPEDEVRPPPLPIDRMSAEAHTLALTAESARAELVAKGLDPAQIERLPVLARAATEAQSQVNALRGAQRSQDEIALENEAVELRADMMAAGRFGLRKNNDAQAALDRVQEGNGLDDLVQDLKDLAAINDRYAADLEVIGADPKGKAARARALAGKLEIVLATRRAADRTEHAAMDTRDRAATLLAETMADVRAAGVYAFRKDPRMLAKFRSAYNQRRRKAVKPPDAEEPSPLSE
ncbi:MAG TPA: hypothetical protein VFS43_39935 [Polyangiaceae bacterium]|nr:hypothetical protein [Polyangiaceae bacterium]